MCLDPDLSEVCLLDQISTKNWTLTLINILMACSINAINQMKLVVIICRTQLASGSSLVSKQWTKFISKPTIGFSRFPGLFCRHVSFLDPVFHLRLLTLLHSCCMSWQSTLRCRRSCGIMCCLFLGSQKRLT